MLRESERWCRVVLGSLSRDATLSAFPSGFWAVCFGLGASAEKKETGGGRLALMGLEGTVVVVVVTDPVSGDVGGVALEMGSGAMAESGSGGGVLLKPSGLTM